MSHRRGFWVEILKGSNFLTTGQISQKKCLNVNRGHSPHDIKVSSRLHLFPEMRGEQKFQ